MAMVADYEHPAQKRIMLRQVGQVADLDIIPMVCPKFPGAVSDVPNRCIVAISVPTGYAGFLPAANEVDGRQLHLLGGHPDQFALLMKMYEPSQIISIDCSTIFLKAQFGAYWSPKKNDWQYAEKNTATTHELTVKSALNVTRYLDAPPSIDGARWNKRRFLSICQMRMSFKQNGETNETTNL
jgi:hypothetical protein